MLKLILFLLAVSAWAQYPIDGGIGGGGSGGGSCTAGVGILVTPTCTISADTATMLSRARGQSGLDTSAVSASASPTAYTAALTPTLTAYEDGMRVLWEPDVNCTGSVSTTLNLDTLGAKRVYQYDGTSNPLAAQCTAGLKIPLAYDTALTAAAGGWRILGGSASSSVSATGPYLTVSGTNYLAASMYAVSLPSAQTWVDPDTSGGTFTSLTGGGRQLEVPSNSGTVRNRSFDRGANTTFEFVYSVQGQADSGSVTGMIGGVVIRETGSAASRLMVLALPMVTDDSGGAFKITGNCFTNSTTYSGADFISESIPAQNMSLYYLKLVLAGGNWTLSVSSTGLASTWVQFAQWSETACSFGAAGTHVGIMGRNTSATAGPVYISLLSVSKS